MSSTDSSWEEVEVEAGPTRGALLLQEAAKAEAADRAAAPRRSAPSDSCSSVDEVEIHCWMEQAEASLSVSGCCGGGAGRSGEEALLFPATAEPAPAPSEASPPPPARRAAGLFRALVLAGGASLCCSLRAAGAGSPNCPAPPTLSCPLLEPPPFVPAPHLYAAPLPVGVALRSLAAVLLARRLLLGGKAEAAPLLLVSEPEIELQPLRAPAARRATPRKLPRSAAVTPRASPPHAECWGGSCVTPQGRRSLRLLVQHSA